MVSPTATPSQSDVLNAWILLACVPLTATGAQVRACGERARQAAAALQHGLDKCALLGLQAERLSGPCRHGVPTPQEHHE